MNTTIFLSDNEKVFYCSDNPIVHVFVVLLTILIVACIFAAKNKKRIVINTKVKRILTYTLLLLYGATLFVIFSRLKLYPIFDQNKVYKIAGEMLNHDFSAFLKGGYGEKWTNQWGYLLFLEIIYKLFGIQNLDAICMINILFIVGTVYNIYIFSQKFFKINSVSILIILCAFVPVWTFSTFIYGNVPSWFFCILSINLLHSFFENENVWCGIFSIISITIALVLKTTSILFLIAYLIYALIKTIFEKKDNKVLAGRIIIIIGCILLYFLSGKVVHFAVENQTGMKLGDGVPRTAHIAMAMHEDGKNSGWYNGYIDSVYEENSYDADKTQNDSIEDIKKSMEKFKSDIPGTIGFLSRKISSQWLEPTYESLFILFNRNTYSDRWQYAANELQNDSFAGLLVKIMNLLQSITYFGAFMYYASIIGEIRNIDKTEDVFPLYMDYTFSGIVFIGAFIFYAFWEANSQYAIFYVFMVIPCAVMGYLKLISGYNSAAREEKGLLSKNGFEKIKIPSGCLILILITLFVTAILPSDSNLKRLLGPDWSDKDYKIYTQELKENGIKQTEYIPIQARLTATEYDNEGKAKFKKGRYYISPANSNNKYLVPDGVKSGADIRLGNDDNRVILTSTEKGYTFRFQISQLVMDVEMASTEPGTRVQQWESNGDTSQIFRFVNVSENEYLIEYANGLYLTAHQDGCITVEEHALDNELQIWKVEKEKREDRL